MKTFEDKFNTFERIIIGLINSHTKEIAGLKEAVDKLRNEQIEKCKRDISPPFIT